MQEEPLKYVHVCVCHNWRCSWQHNKKQYHFALNRAHHWTGCPEQPCVHVNIVVTCMYSTWWRVRVRWEQYMVSSMCWYHSATQRCCPGSQHTTIPQRCWRRRLQKTWGNVNGSLIDQWTAQSSDNLTGQTLAQDARVWSNSYAILQDWSGFGWIRSVHEYDIRHVCCYRIL